MDSIKVQLMFDGVWSMFEDSDYFCHLCKKEINGLDYATQHVMESLHTKNLVALSKIFTFKNGSISCKLCSFEGTWLSIEKHRDVHKDVATVGQTTQQTEQYNLYKHMILNGIIKHAVDGFFCRFCTVQIITWNEALHHSKDPTHKAKKSRGSLNKSSPKELMDELYKEMFVNGITIVEGTRYFCEYCFSNIWDTSNIVIHIIGNKHASMKNSMRCKINQSMAGGYVEAISKASNDLKIPKQLKSVLVSHGLLIFPKQVYCRACCCSLKDMNAIQVHLLLHLQRIWPIEKAVEPKNISESSQVSSSQETSHSLERIKSQDKEISHEQSAAVIESVGFSMTAYCPKCMIYFCDEETLVVHLRSPAHKRTHCSIEQSSAKLAQKPEPQASNVAAPKEVLYNCNLCNIQFKEDQMLIQHFGQTLHILNTLRGIKENMCSISEKQGQLSDETKKSNNVNSLVYKCDLCNVQVARDITLVYHFYGKKHKSNQDRLLAGTDVSITSKEAEATMNVKDNNLSSGLQKLSVLSANGSASDENMCRISEKQGQLPVNEEKKKSNNVNSLVYKCDLCNVKVARDIMLVDHFNGKKHKSNQGRLLAGTDVSITSKEAEATMNVKDNNLSSGLQKLSVLSANGSASDENMCRISEKQGQLPVNEEKKKSNNVNSLVYKCDLCNVKVARDIMLVDHFNGKKHKSNQGRLLAGTDVSITSKEEEATTSVKDNDLSSGLRKLLTLSANWNASDENMCSISEKQRQLPVNEEKKKSNNVNSLVYKCDLCNVKVERDKMLVEHFNGKKHKSNQNRLLAGTDVSITSKEEEATTNVKDNDLSSGLWKLLTLSANGKECSNSKAEKIVEEKMEYACFTCNGKFTSETQLNEHINGKRHRSRMLVYPNVGATRSTSQKKNSASSDTSASTSDTSTTMQKKRKRKPAIKKNTESKKSPDFFKTLKSKYLGSAIDVIYEVKSERIREVKLSTQMSFSKDAQSIYCLVCGEKVPNKLQSYYEHIRCVPHLNNLELMIKDDMEFEDSPDEFSDLALAKDFMQELSDERVKCFACDVDLWNKDSTLRQHIATEAHGEKRKCWKRMTQRVFDEILSQIEQIWYYSQKYCCQLCNCVFDIDAKFGEHLDDDKHRAKLKSIGISPDKLVYEFCAPCATLWIGCADSFTRHCQDKMHKYMVQNCFYMERDMPDSATQMLKNTQECVDELIEQSDKDLAHERRKENEVLTYLESTAKTKFPSATAYSFGSRISRLGFPNSDIDIFIDCGNTYYGENSATSRQLLFIETIKNCLLDKEETWAIEEILTHCRTPIIKSIHRPTEMKCDIVVTNGLSVENTNLLKCFLETYPLCRKLILFLKKWLAQCDLSGAQYITSYALAWYVIFYLQTESILPSIDRLIKLRNKSKIVAGWEVGVSYEFHFNQPSLTLSELLLGFYEYYAEFDYRFDVVCPLIGRTVKKRAFLESATLPKEMTRYVEYLATSKDPEHFRIDSAMCIQDPFDLSHNLTKAVPKFALNRFRQFCSQCANILHESVTV